MATRKKPAEKTGMSEQEPINVLELLKEDHRSVKQLFTSFEEADGRSRQGIAEEALSALKRFQHHRGKAGISGDSKATKRKIWLLRRMRNITLLSS